MVKNLSIIGVLVIGLLAFCIFEEYRYAKAVRPPPGATNLLFFLNARPAPFRIRKFVQGEKIYVEVIGKVVSSLLVVPSGPPAYVFDETGALVDGTGDRGDDPDFVRKWGSLSHGTFISVEEATVMVKNRQP